MTTSSLFAFYHVTTVTTTEDWICDNIIKYYDAKTGQKRKEEIAGSCKKRKELEIVASPVSEYDITCKKKAQEILDDWKVLFY
jgi:ABC-type Na+ transport system ATPase subunit NatA